MEKSPYLKNRFFDNQFLKTQPNLFKKYEFSTFQNEFPRKRRKFEEKSLNYEKKVDIDKFCKIFERVERMFSEENEGISKFFLYVDKMVNAFQSFPGNFQGKCENCENSNQVRSKYDFIQFAQALNQVQQFNKTQLMICEDYGVTSEDLTRRFQEFSDLSQESLEKYSESDSEVPKTPKIDFSEFLKTLPKVDPIWKLELKVEKLQSSISMKKEALKTCK